MFVAPVAQPAREEPKSYDSVYSAVYEPGGQLVFLEDLITTDVYATLEWTTFWNLTVNHFGHQRAQRIAQSLTAGRPMRICWSELKAGVTPSSPFRAMDVLGQMLSKPAIEAMTGTKRDGTYEDLQQLKRELTGSLDF